MSVDITKKSAKPSLNSQAKKQRRTILASIAAAGTVTSLPSRWTKPIVDHALLPVHAQMSTATATAAATATTTITATAQGPINCDRSRIRTRFYQDTLGAFPTATGTSLAFMNVTLNDVGATVCTDPLGATTSALGTDILTFSSTSVSYFLSEGIPDTSTTFMIPSGSVTTGPVTYTTTVTATTTV